MKNVVVLLGGPSVEHDVSIVTGLGVVKNLSSEYNVMVVYVNNQGQWLTGQKLKELKTYQNHDFKGLKKCSFTPNTKSLTVFSLFGNKKVPVYCVVNCMHGRMGEDGCVQGMLNLAKIPSTSASVVASSVCMDKKLTKTFLKANGIDVVEDVSFNKEKFKFKDDIVKRIERELGYPCIVKPNSLGSSVGVCVVSNQEELLNAIESALVYDDKVLVEKYIQNARELNIAVGDFDGVVTSNIEEVYLETDVYDFESKYKNKGIKRIVPAKLNSTLKKKIESVAKKAYDLLCCEGVVRSDFLYGDKLYLNELNTIPGSLAFYLWKEPKIEIKKYLRLLIESSVEKFDKKDLKSDIESNILNTIKDESFLIKK